MSSDDINNEHIHMVGQVIDDLVEDGFLEETGEDTVKITDKGEEKAIEIASELFSGFISKYNLVGDYQETFEVMVDGLLRSADVVTLLVDNSLGLHEKDMMNTVPVVPRSH